MIDIADRLKTEFDALAVCHCGLGMDDGSCDNHDPKWNPCETTELLDDARNEILRLRKWQRDVIANRSHSCIIVRPTFLRHRKGDPWWWCVTPTWLDRRLGLTRRWG